MNFLSNILLEGNFLKQFGDNWQLPIMIVAFVAFFYFFVIRPQNKKKKEMQNMLDSIKKGDKVVTIGGIHGKVSTVKDNEITIRVDSNTEITFEKVAIARVSKATGNKEEENNKEKDNKDIKKDKKDK